MTTQDTMPPLLEHRPAQHLHRYDEAVLEALQSTTQHPTAIEIYEMARRTNPHLGRATVYRALQRLETAGLALAVGRDTRGRHYDAHTTRHDHAICSGCGQLFDLTTSGRFLPPDALERFYHAAKAVGLEPDTWEMRVHGQCASCRKAQPPAE